MLVIIVRAAELSTRTMEERQRRCELRKQRDNCLVQTKRLRTNITIFTLANQTDKGGHQPGPHLSENFAATLQRTAEPPSVSPAMPVLDITLLEQPSQRHGFPDLHRQALLHPALWQYGSSHRHESPLLDDSTAICCDRCRERRYRPKPIGLLRKGSDFGKAGSKLERGLMRNVDQNTYGRARAYFDSNLVPNTFVASTYRNQLNSFMAAM
jgi:hypothetical protein